MSKRLLSAAARGLVALSLLGLGLAGDGGPRPARVHADEIDCEDKDNFDDPDCVQLRQQSAPPLPLQGQTSPPPQESSPPPAEEPPPPPPEGEELPPDMPPQPDTIAKKNNPADIIFTVADAGKEATQYDGKDGTDECGRWALSRFERERELSPSRLGPNVIYTKAWVCKDAESAKQLFKKLSENKNLKAVFDPLRSRSEVVSGPNEKFKYGKYAEETWATSAYYDGDKWVGRHYLFLHRKGPNIGQMYLFGREDYFDEWDKGVDDWFSRTYAGRL
jgi:hypothetical protein